MTAEHWVRVEALFHRVLEAPPSEREALVKQLCEGDAVIFAELLTLLRSDSVVERLMARAPASADGKYLIRETASQDADTTRSWLGRSIGPFLIEKILGRGGMGVVYLGRRTSGGLTQNVAIKVIARHLRNSPAVSQFLDERHVLGRLEHPHIARLIDGGLHDTTPYVVMEYVEGKRLDEICDDPTVPVVTKIELFLQLCGAVAYVHSHLILHRDLKPSNVMVTAGSVKLLDFGTLKRVDVEAADSLMTRSGIRSVTLRYASPEHLAGRPVSTATDVYSLGVVLYRILSGRLPAMGSEAAAADPAVALPEVTKTRQLRRDLEAIVSKALRYEPGQRFSSVDAMAEDLRNALANRPVRARAGSLRYRAGKFYLRHGTILHGVAAILVTLVAGLIAVAHEGAVAMAETLHAEAGVEDERKLAHLLLFDYFEQLKAIPGSTDAQRRAVSQALVYLDGLAQDGPGSALALDRVDAYTKMGNLLGNPYEENIGDGAGAVATLQKAVVLSRQLLTKLPDDLHALQSSAGAEQSLGRVYFGSGDPKLAAEHLRPAADISRRIVDIPGADVATIAQAASVVDSLGDVYGQEGAVTLDDPKAAIAAYEQAQAIDARGLRLDANCARCRRGVALEYWKIGMLMETSDQDQAATLYENGLTTLARLPTTELATARVLRLDTVIRQRLGNLLIAAGHGPSGIQMLSEVRLRFRDAARADPMDARARFDFAALDASLADGYEHEGDRKEARAAEREFLDTMTTLVAQDGKNAMWRLHRAEALVRWGTAEIELGDAAQGQRARNEGLGALIQIARTEDSDTSVLDMAANALTDAHREPQLALTFAERAVSAKREPVQALITLARTQRAAGHTVDAHATAEQALKLLEAHPKSVGNKEQVAQARGLM
jgi:tetratricopeptide (TPR) repeat protein/predicted Ser/Thr protein kinase